MVLDLDLFRVDKGGDPERVKQTVTNRYKDVQAVDQVVDLDSKWRKCRHDLDRLNKAKNSISKSYGSKMKSQKNTATAEDAAAGDSKDQDPLDLSSLFLAVDQIASPDVTLLHLKRLRTCTEEQTIKLTKEMAEYEQERNEILREIGNLLHPDVPISDDEDNNAIIRTSGNIALGANLTSDEAFKSHVDLISMIGGINSERGSVIAGLSFSLFAVILS